MAEKGYLTIAFDPSFTGESTGTPRYMASPDINTEDFQAAIDFLSVQENVDQEKIGIIGLTGSGKSTILQLINRSYKISQGELNILGTNINEYTNEQIKLIVKLIEQKPNFYNTTIEENIKMGKNVPKKDIQKALKYSESYEFVQNLKEKENTKLENNANNLSGGQKQRISLARAFTRKSPNINVR